MIKKIREAYSRHPDLVAAGVLLIAFLIIFLFDMFVLNRGGVWGSSMDWSDQHFAIPEYLRMRLYETGDWYPDFAFQLGGGQNIYNFAYYGIANPLYLPAYFMPDVTMALYIQVLSIAEVILSSFLCYRLFRKHFSGILPLVLALMFIFSGPLIFHSHRHIMFINYYPFLIGLLFAVRGKGTTAELAVISLLSYCMVCTSYYYSVGSFAAVCVYMIYCCLEEKQDMKIREILGRIWKKLLFMVMGCICAARFWMPALAAIVSGRASTSVSVSWQELLIPTTNLSVLLYTAYSAGLTCIVPLSMIALLKHGSRSDRFLAGIMSCCVLFPVIVYLFNGTMYIDGKAFIPFIPLLLMLCGRFFVMFREKKIKVRCTAMVFFVVLVISLREGNYNTLQTVFVLIDSFMLVLVMWISVRKDKRDAVAAMCLVMSFAVSLVVGFTDHFEKYSAISEFYSSDTRELVSDVLDEDEGFYRFAEDTSMQLELNNAYRTDYLTTNVYSSLTNPSYRNFRFYASGSEVGTRNNAIHLQPLNIVFNTFMGCRYRLAKNDDIMFGEVEVADSGDYCVYKNENAFPIGFASSDTMSLKNYAALPWELQQEALLTNIIVPDGTGGNGKRPDRTEKLDVDFVALSDYKGISYSNRLFTIKSKKNIKADIPLDEPVEDKVIIVTAFADNRVGRLDHQADIYLVINGVKNKLTDPNWKYQNGNFVFSYIISSDKPITHLDMEFSAGNYNISGLEAYTLDGSVLRGANDNKDALIVERDGSIGDSITGTVNVREDGWFNFTIPYDKHFTIKVDGEEVSYRKTDLAFIGFPIKAGEHTVELTYNAPLRREGFLVTYIGVGVTVLLLVVFVLYGAVKSKKKTAAGEELLQKPLDRNDKI